MGTEHQLRTGTMAQKRAVLTKLAQDYQISFEDEASPDYQAPDPQVTALQQQVQQLQGAQQYNILSAQQQRQDAQLNEINSFAAAQTEQGQPYAPYFEEVKEDMVRMAQAYGSTGQQPGLSELYEQACWANPQVRAKMVSADKHCGRPDAQSGREGAAAKGQAGKRRDYQAQGLSLRRNSHGQSKTLPQPYGMSQSLVNLMRENPMAAPNLSEIATTTIASRTRIARRQRDRKYCAPVEASENARQGETGISGGETINQELEYAENSTYTSFSVATRR